MWGGGFGGSDYNDGPKLLFIHLWVCELKVLKISTSSYLKNNIQAAQKSSSIQECVLHEFLRQQKLIWQKLLK